MTPYDITITVFRKNLLNVDRWLDKAAQHAKAKKFDPQVLLQSRLSPDQFALGRQVQAACDTAKYAAAKLTGKEPPSHPDTERTVDELRARIATCVAYLDTFTQSDFAGAEERRCVHSWMQGKSMRGSAYLEHFALPNFFFHMTTAYAILRHDGVELGKFDFLGDVPMEG